MADYTSLLRAGRTLTVPQIRELEANLKVAPENIVLRAKFLGYLHEKAIRKTGARAAWSSQVIWFIENHPEEDVLSLPECSCMSLRGDSSQVYKDIAATWQKALERTTNIRVILNGAAFFGMEDRKKCLDLLSKVRKANPENIAVLRELCLYSSLHCVYDKPTTDEIVQCIRIHEELRMHEQSDIHILNTLAFLAYKLADFESAERYADLIAYQNSSSHLAHSIKGLVSLMSGSVEQAKSELLKSGNSKGYFEQPILAFELANALLNRGERKAVCTYLRSCKHYWAVGRLLVPIWIVQIKLGLKPRLTASVTEAVGCQ